MSAIYLVRGHCQNYECGCGGGHVLAVCGTQDLANAFAEELKGGDYFDFTIKVTGPFAVGALVPEDAR